MMTTFNQVHGLMPIDKNNTKESKISYIEQVGQFNPNGAITCLLKTKENIQNRFETLIDDDEITCSIFRTLDWNKKIGKYFLQNIVEDIDALVKEIKYLDEGQKEINRIFHSNSVAKQQLATLPKELSDSAAQNLKELFIPVILKIFNHFRVCKLYAISCSNNIDAFFTLYTVQGKNCDTCGQKKTKNDMIFTKSELDCEGILDALSYFGNMLDMERGEVTTNVAEIWGERAEEDD